MSQLFSQFQMPSGDSPSSDSVSPEAVEELGPGDVQHLQGRSKKNSDPTSPLLQHLNWLEGDHRPDELIQSVERSLSEVILGSMPESQVVIPSVHPIDQSTKVGQTVAIPHSAQVESSSPTQDAGLTLDDLGDVELDIAIELGRSELLIDDVMKLREGSVVTLDKRAGDPVDIIANGRLVARGELLVIDGMFGVRLSEVL